VRLVAGSPARAELLERHHQLHGVEHPDDARQLRRRQAVPETDELVAGHVNVDEHAREALVGQRHRLHRDVQVEAVRDEEAVDHVELVCRTAVEAHDDAVLDDELRRRV
jgi:hypothetical protein